MKRASLKLLKKNFNIEKEPIYLAGPFFNDIQRKWALKIADLLEERGYRIYAPVREQYDGKKDNANLIFRRNVIWLKDSGLVLAQLDYPMMGEKILSVLDRGAWSYRPLKIPDAGTIWEMGYAHALEIPVLGYTFTPQVELNLMLAEGLAGFLEYPENVFTPNGINWNLITEWKGQKI